MTKDLPLIHELTHNDIRLAKMLKRLETGALSHHGIPGRETDVYYGDIVISPPWRNQRLATSQVLAKQV